jgi:hypothetical protein
VTKRTVLKEEVKGVSARDSVDFFECKISGGGYDC